MSSFHLPAIHSNAEYNIENALDLFDRGLLPLDKMGFLSINYRVRGICDFLQESDRNSFQLNLQKSAASHLYFLQHANTADKITGRGGPFFDAIACNDLLLAKEIARFSRKDWNRDYEYEDDFLYVMFLMGKYCLDWTQEIQSTVLENFADIVGNDENPRLRICRALMLADSIEFNVALSAMVHDRDNTMSKAKREQYIFEEEWATEGHVFIEGLALLRFADFEKILVQENYKYLPSSALLTEELQFDSEIWKTA